MKEGPDIAMIGALLGDPARANILIALLGGQPLTAGELAREAGVSPQTTSGHLGRLYDGGLLTVAKQGRHPLLQPEQSGGRRASGTAVGPGRSRGRDADPSRSQGPRAA